MTKKLSIVVTLLLVVALAAPTSAATFTDVSEDHWAYEAVNELVAAGIITGYPDGTFKGDDNLTRYEISMVISRLLDRVEEEREALAEDLGKDLSALNDQVGEMRQGFTAQEKVALEDIVKSMVEKNVPEKQEGLTDKQAEQVANLIEALTFKYKAELKVLGTDMETLEKNMQASDEELEARIAALENAEPVVSFNGEYAVDFRSFLSEGEGTLYEDPFDTEDEDDDPVEFDEDEYFTQTLDLNFAVNKGPVSADLNMNATVDPFGAVNDADDNMDFAVNSLSGTISGETFEATIDHEQEVDWKPYLYDEADANGVVGTVEGYNFVLSGVEVEEVDEEGEDYVAPENYYVAAAQSSKDLMGQTFNFNYGVKEDKLADEFGEERTFVAGVDTTLEMAGIEVTPELALNNTEFENRYFTVGAEGDLGPVATTFNYKNITDGFEGIEAAPADNKGFDVKGEMSFGPVDTAASYESYEGSGADYDGISVTEFTAEITEENAVNLAGFDVYADGQYRTFGEEEATRMAYNTTAKNSFGKMDVTGKLEYAVDSDEYFNIENDADEDYEQDDMFDKSVEMDYNFSDALTAGALYELDQDNELTQTYDATYTMSDALTATAEWVYADDLTQTYTADYVKGMLSAGFETEIADDTETVIYAGLDPDAYTIATVSLDPYFNYERNMLEEAQDTVFGVDAEKALSERATLTGSYEYANKALYDESDEDVDALNGLKVTKAMGLEYKIADNVSATANYMDLDFDADTEGNSYQVKEATAGVSISF